MKLLWLSHNIPFPPIGGVLQRNYHLIRQASSRAEVHLVALRQSRLCPDASALSEAVEALKRFCASVRVHSIDWEDSTWRRMRLGFKFTLGRLSYDVARFHSTSCHRALGHEQSSVDLLHVDTLGLIPYRSYFKTVPAVLNHHNIESCMMRRRAEGERRVAFRLLLLSQARKLQHLEQRFAPGFDRNLVVSDLDQARLVDVVGPCRTSVVPNGVDTQYFDVASELADGSRRLIFVGGQAWYPNRDAVTYFLGEIWPRILALRSDVEFVIIGRAPCQAALQAARLDSRIRVLGFVDDIREEVGRAAVFILPYREGGGTRLKFLDALAMRRAIVSTTVGAEGVQARDGEQFVLADEPERFAAEVVKLLDDGPRRRRLGEAGRRLAVEKFDWSVIGDSLCGAYAAALRRE